jgi:CheY-like chemotaxis protein
VPGPRRSGVEGPGSDSVSPMLVWLSRHDDVPEQGAEAFRSNRLLGAFLLGEEKGGVVDETTESKLRVLIAEDETIIRVDLRGLLEDAGVVVCGEARNGREAVELARELQPDAAIVDIRMPELDGIEVCRRIYAERPIPVLVLTAFADRTLVERALEAGAFSYLVKPFRETDVIPALHAAVKRHAELLEARRSVGGSGRSIAIGVRSKAGHVWPVDLHRRADGSVSVTVVPSRAGPGGDG